MGNEWDELPEKELEPWWSCHSCTFRNHESLPRCEMCETERMLGVTKNARVVKDEAAYVPLTMSTSSHHWPALPEAWLPVDEESDSWLDCDVSSIASSWLDLGVADENADGVDEDDILGNVVRVPAVTHAPQPTEFPLWSDVVARQVGTAKIPLPLLAVVMPPLS